MRIRFLVGPAGSGKTFRCLTEIREQLAASTEGPTLLLLTPKQATYQWERQLLSEPSLAGYTRLQILSFERLADLVFRRLGRPAPDILDEEGRLMVLRALLTKKRDKLNVFRASARLTGFAQQLSLVLREVQRQQLTPGALKQLARQIPENPSLAFKLQDLALLLQEYLQWLEAHELQDADGLLATATEALKNCSSGSGPNPKLATGRELEFGDLWVDGFAEFSEQELDFLGALMPHCRKVTLAFCLDPQPKLEPSWRSHWCASRKTFEKCRKRFCSLPGAEVMIEELARISNQSRFAERPALQQLEQAWDSNRTEAASAQNAVASLRLIVCADPEAEAKLAAREILRHVRRGGRYRDIAVLVRNLEPYHQVLQRVFSRYEIPFFLDRRESVSHHPLAELTRSALRTVGFGWQRDDWFAALKTGLMPASETEIDRLENEALARGWHGPVWQTPIVIERQPELTSWVAALQVRLLPPFQRFALSMSLCEQKPTGPQLAAAVRELWEALRIEKRLEDWATAESDFSTEHLPGSLHVTVWEQMNSWLENVELAFPTEALSLREWLPILEAGLANLTVGLIPPALDQVLLGAIDRSRNPDLQLALVLGLNEGVFPSSPHAAGLLTDDDLLELERRDIVLGSAARQHLGREAYYAYIACTRARQRLVLTCASRNHQATPLNPSPFFKRVRQLFPEIPMETATADPEWSESEHVSEFIGPFLHGYGASLAAERGDSQQGYDQNNPPAKAALPPTDAASRKARGADLISSVPGLSNLLERLRQFREPAPAEPLAPELAVRLYGPVLRSSVSRLEQFAACPFKFFVHSGLRAEERKTFELDVKEQGSFQHDLLALFHEDLASEGKRWRDLTPQEARERVARLARHLMISYREGLLQASAETRFLARVLSESLQDFVETLIGWMREQYRFDPVRVELPFGGDEHAPPWALPLDENHRLELYGRIDRVDLFLPPGSDEALCVVVDYKSSHRQLDPMLMAHGLQLQLLAYLSVLRHWANPRSVFGAARLTPAGVFYVNLRGKYDRPQNRAEALTDTDQARKSAYRHVGRFDSRVLPQLDARPGVRQGDQFNYRLNKAGGIHGACREVMTTAQFQTLLDSVENNLKNMGRQIYAGSAQVSPYRKGSTTACNMCGYQSICRIDPWTHRYRLLKQVTHAELG